MHALLIDVGGTKTQLAFLDKNGQINHSATFPNQDFPQFQVLLSHYLNTYCQNVENTDIEKAVIAVAGPVDDGTRCQLTNVNWLIDGAQLSQQFSIPQIRLINDLQATAWGLTPVQSPPELTMLWGETIDYSQPVLVIAPGTGLGQTCIYPHENSYIIHATEGGHKTIAPFNTKMASLVQVQWQKHNRPVSWENWFSGSGLKNLYQALFPDQISPSNESLSKMALASPDSDAGLCIQLFTQGIFAEAGNLLLQYLAWGGVIIAGGIPPKIKPFFQQQENIEYIHAKNEYLDRLQRVPIALCEHTNVPLQGAANYCLYMM